MEGLDYRIPYCELSEPLDPHVEMSVVALQVVAVYIYEVKPDQWVPLVVLHTGSSPHVVTWWFGIRPTREEAEGSVRVLFEGIARARDAAQELHPSVTDARDALWDADGTPTSPMVSETMLHFERHVRPLLKEFNGKVPAEPMPRSFLVDPRS